MVLKLRVKQLIGSTTGFRDGTCPLGCKVGLGNRTAVSRAVPLRSHGCTHAEQEGLPFPTVGGIFGQHWCEVWLTLYQPALPFLQLLLFENRTSLLCTFCPTWIFCRPQEMSVTCPGPLLPLSGGTGTKVSLFTGDGTVREVELQKSR